MDQKVSYSSILVGGFKRRFYLVLLNSIIISYSVLKTLIYSDNQVLNSFLSSPPTNHRYFWNYFHTTIGVHQWVNWHKFQCHNPPLLISSEIHYQNSNTYLLHPWILQIWKEYHRWLYVLYLSLPIFPLWGTMTQDPLPELTWWYQLT